MFTLVTKCTNEDPSSKTVRISFATYQDLAKLGRFGDSFDSVIRGLLSNQGLVVKTKDSSENKQVVQKGNAEPSNPYRTQQTQNDNSQAIQTLPIAKEAEGP